MKEINIEKFDPKDPILLNNDERRYFTQYSNFILGKLIVDVYAMSIWVYLQTLPPTWVINIYNLRVAFGIGEDKLRRHIQFLCQCNLMENIQERNESGEYLKSRLRVLGGNAFDPKLMKVIKRTKKEDGAKTEDSTQKEYRARKVQERTNNLKTTVPALCGHGTVPALCGHGTVPALCGNGKVQAVYKYGMKERNKETTTMVPRTIGGRSPVDNFNEQSSLEKKEVEKKPLPGDVAPGLDKTKKNSSSSFLVETQIKIDPLISHGFGKLHADQLKSLGLDNDLVNQSIANYAVHLENPQNNAAIQNKQSYFMYVMRKTGRFVNVKNPHPAQPAPAKPRFFTADSVKEEKAVNWNKKFNPHTGTFVERTELNAREEK